MLSKNESKVLVMEDDIASDDSNEADIEDLTSDDELEEPENESDLEKDTKPKIKKVADIMNKILSAEEKGPTILSRSKRKPGKLYTPSEEDKRVKELKAERHTLKTARRNMGRTTIEDTDFVKEKKLRIIATQGVVQLFSTFQKYNTELTGELDGAKTNYQKEKVVAKKQMDFMKILDKEGNKLREEDIDTPLKSESDSKWNVFAGDFYKEPTLKGWDKNDSDDE